jgi:hypothetical protein
MHAHPTRLDGHSENKLITSYNLYLFFICTKFIAGYVSQSIDGFFPRNGFVTHMNNFVSHQSKHVSNVLYRGHSV